MNLARSSRESGEPDHDKAQVEVVVLIIECWLRGPPALKPSVSLDSTSAQLSGCARLGSSSLTER